MPRSMTLWTAGMALAAGMAGGAAQAAPFMIVGNHEKLVWDDEGKPVMSAPGKDNVVIVDLAIPRTRRSSPTCRSRTRSSVRP